MALGTVPVNTVLPVRSLQDGDAAAVTSTVGDLKCLHS